MNLRKELNEPIYDLTTHQVDQLLSLFTQYVEEIINAPIIDEDYQLTDGILLDMIRKSQRTKLAMINSEKD